MMQKKRIRPVGAPEKTPERTPEEESLDEGKTPAGGTLL